ncbi:MAG: HEAT repeat domain-containing protein [Candidatus Sumerlaeota bacterium]|nr:HEAT repeat domain-containing protein [Candidatus Sumerlaeota bacterium]
MTRRIAFMQTPVLALIFLASMSYAATVSEIVSQMPAENGEETARLCKELVKLGPKGVRGVCDMILPPGAGDDSAARYALGSLALYVHRPGAPETERAMFVDAALKALGAASDKQVQAFLISQLERIGKDECVEPLAAFLSDETLCEPATRALLAIHTAAARAAIAQALPAAKGANRVTIIKALGVLREKSVADQILPDASNPDREARLVALYALANIGAPQAKDVLAKAAEAQAPYERAKATSYYLLFARRLAEDGETRECEEICRSLMKARLASGEPQAAASALQTLVDALGEKAMPDLLAAAVDDNAAFRAAALRFAAAIPGEAATSQWRETMKDAAPPVKADILAMLARRGDASALPDALAALKDSDETVRQAAVEAAGRLGGMKALPDLIAVLASGQGADAKAAREVVARLPGDEAMAAVAKALPRAPGAARVAMLEILASRDAASQLDAVLAQTKADDESVRLAAVRALGALAAGKDMPMLMDLLRAARSDAEVSAAQKAVASVVARTEKPKSLAATILAARSQAEGQERARLLGVLAAIGGTDALDAVVADTKSADPAVQDVAIHALADWSSLEAAPALLAVARGEGAATRQALALRGYIRLAETAGVPAAKKVEMLKNALAAAQRPDEKRLALAGLSAAPSRDAFEEAAKWLDDPEVRSEAASAVAEIAFPAKGRGVKDLSGPQVDEALRKALPLVANEEWKSKIEKQLSASGKAGAAASKPARSKATRGKGKSPASATP